MSCNPFLKSVFTRALPTDSEEQITAERSEKVVRGYTPSRQKKGEEVEISERSPRVSELKSGEQLHNHNSRVANGPKARRSKIMPGPGKRICKRIDYRRHPNQFEEEDEPETVSRIKLLLSII